MAAEVHRGRLRRTERALSIVFFASVFVMIAMTPTKRDTGMLGRRHKRPHGPNKRELRQKRRKWHSFDADMVPKGLERLDSLMRQLDSFLLFCLVRTIRFIYRQLD